MGAVDVWAQQVTPRMAQQPWMASLLRWTRQSASSVSPPVQRTIEAMDEADIDIALLSAWYGPTGALISNDEALEAVRQRPERFRALVSVDLRNPMNAVRTIRDLAPDDAVVGVRIVPWLWELPPDDRLYYPVYAACVESGLPFCTQIGHTGPLRSSETGRPIPYLERVLLDFPELVVVGGHVGFPWLEEVLSLMVKFPNFYADSSAYAVRRLPAAFVELAAGLGRDRVMFGTNYPMLTPARALEGLPQTGWSDDVIESFLSATARRVFNLPAKARG